MSEDTSIGRRNFIRGAVATGAALGLPMLAPSMFAADGAHGLPPPRRGRRHLLPPVAPLRPHGCLAWLRLVRVGASQDRSASISRSPPAVAALLGFLRRVRPEMVAAGDRPGRRPRHRRVPVRLVLVLGRPAHGRSPGKRLPQGPQPQPDQVRPDVGQPPTGATSFRSPTTSRGTTGCRMRHSPADLARVIDYCIDHYFRQPNYWTVEGRLFFSVFRPEELHRSTWRRGEDQITPGRHRPAAGARRSCRRSTGTPCTWAARRFPRATTPGSTRPRTTTSPAAARPPPTSPKTTKTSSPAHVQHLEGLGQDARCPYCPVVTMGWDNTPRLEHNVPPLQPDYLRPRRCGQHPGAIRPTVQAGGGPCCGRSKRPPAVFVNAWNEWTEGSYLLPERRHGEAYLAALQAAFRRLCESAAARRPPRDQGVRRPWRFGGDSAGTPARRGKPARNRR